jgi:hypothetical protein
MVLFCGPLAAAEADSLSFSGTNRRLAKEKMTNKLVITFGIKLPSLAFVSPTVCSYLYEPSFLRSRR